MKNLSTSLLFLCLLVGVLKSSGQAILNPSFENPDIPLDQAQYNPSGGSWTFSDRSGIVETTIVDSTHVFEPPHPTPDGSQIAFLQFVGHAGSFSQQINFPADGEYTLTYYVAGRQASGPSGGHTADGALPYSVLIDSDVITSDSTTSFQGWTRRELKFTTTQGAHLLKFLATSPAADPNDHTAFFDSISLQSSQHPPVANDQSVTTDQETPKVVTLTATDADNDPLTYQVVTPPTHGTLTGTAPNLTYTPTSGYSGPDSFTFKANDGQADSGIATVAITVTGRPDLKGCDIRIWVPPHPDSSWANPPDGPVPVNYEFVVDIAVCNEGVSPSGQFGVSFYLSTDGNISTATDTLLVGTDGSTTLSFDSIDPGHQKRLGKKFLLPALPESHDYAGQLWIGAVIDSNSSVDESKEDNNYNQGEGLDMAKLFLVDANPPHRTFQVGRGTYPEALAWLRRNHFDPPIRPIGPIVLDAPCVWSRESHDIVFSRFMGIPMPANAFRIQAAIVGGGTCFPDIHPTPETRAHQGPFFIEIQGGDSTFNLAGTVPEPNPRTAASISTSTLTGPWLGVGDIPWFQYVYYFHQNF